jgi:sigma-B regulation protein RsbU (phosphoserine phosphatase)
MVTLPPVKLGAILAVSFVAVLLIRKPLEKYVVLPAVETSQPKRQFLMDVSLVILAGIFAGTFNTIAFDFPAGSAVSLLTGCMVIGFFISLDTALARERNVILEAISRDQSLLPPKRLYSMTRKFTIAALASVIFFSIVFISVFSRDIVWLSTIGTDAATLYQAQLSVAYEVSFIMVVLLILVVNLILSYSQNLKLLFANETDVLEKVSQGDLSKKVPVATQDEFGIIAGHTNSMIDGLRHRIQMINALKLAEEIQKNLLPKNPPKHPKLDITGISIYCDEIGGDYYDFFNLPDNKIGIVVADASGHGVSAAMHMTGARAFLHFAAHEYQNPALLLNTINQYVTRDSQPTSRFLSMFFLEIDTADKRLCWVRAGHEPAQFYDPKTDELKELSGDGVALGVLDDYRYQERVLESWSPGSVIVIGTDGIHESRSQKDEMFGKDRLRDIIRRHAAQSAEFIQAAVIDTLRDFQIGSPQEDDITLVVIKLL